ncbi:hypothetical protein Pmani_025905 [Petrolisthes manimaculis]|uniref:Solute carrier family 45 member 3 n=1 Tax=Petrolisthes manimaculis TaxID=1843537 RepID=A0AAE1U0P3_9EUCA|nr:hypothetical protein Pmani_025905 [Petrolisthes manimaculis]
MALVSVPVLAEWSDRCSSPLGRRRPFIMLLSSLLLLSLIIVPYGATIIALVAPDTSPKVNMVVLALGVILLDYSYQALFNPCESLLSDLMATAPEWEQTRGFTVYSAGISLGCILGYLIVSIDWSSIGLLIGTQEQTAFSVIFVLFLPCLFLTLVLAQEKPFRGKGSGSEQERVVKEQTKTAEVNLSVLDLTTDKATLTRDYPSDGGYESGSSESDESSPLVGGSGEGMRWRRYPHLIHQTLHKLSRLPRVTLHRLANSLCKLILRVSLLILYFPYQLAMLPVDTWRRVSTAPVVLRRLFFSELFGWMGIMCHNMFFTDFVGQYMYGGHPDAPERTQEAVLYDEGVRMGSWGLFLHSMTACLYAFCLQQHMVRLAGHRAVFMGGLAIFTVAMSATIVSPSIVFLNVVTALSGIGFAALTSTPNMLVTMYNSDRQLYMWDDTSVTESCEERGLGTDVAVLDIAYFLSQIVLSVCMGPLVDLTGSALPYMVVAALTGAVSVYCGSRVIFTDKHLMQLRVGAF